MEITQAYVVEQAQRFGQKVDVFGFGPKDTEIMILLEFPCEADAKCHVPLSSTAGNIVFKNLNDRYNLNSLIKDLIKNKVDDISKIEKAYLLFGRDVILLFLLLSCIWLQI